jgi:ribose-phosphate pyrophosphokinase
MVHAAKHISAWIKSNVNQPVLIGPDSESEQWVAKVADDADAPFIILEKIRRGDREVDVSVPKVGKYKKHRPSQAGRNESPDLHWRTCCVCR